MHGLVELFRSREPWLMERVVSYAREHGYAQYTSSLVDDWRVSISGLTEVFASAVTENGFQGTETGMHLDREDDAAGRFALEVARRHRNRGVDGRLFLGLFLFFRQAYQDCIREFLPPGRERDRMEYALSRFFDRMNIVICSDWRTLESENGADVLSAVSEVTNEKNRYLIFFERLDQPVILVSPDGFVEKLNRAATRLLGGRGSHGHACFRDRPIGEIFPWLTGALKTGPEGSDADGKNLAVFHGPGGERTFRVTMTSEPDVAGKLKGFFVVLHDETERLRSKNMILQAKEELERTFDTISDMVFLVDDQGVIRRINKALASRLGLSPRDVVGRTCIDALGIDDCHAQGRDGHAPDLPVRYPNLPGAFMVRSNSLFDAGGENIGKVVVARDVTASERIRETLLAVESKYKSIFDHAPVGIFQSTTEGTFLSANATMAAMLGFISTEEMIRHYSDIGNQMYADPEDRELLIAEGLEKESVAAKELQLLRRDGRSFWGRLRGRIVRDTSGQVLYFEGFVEDVTVTRAARENLAQSEYRFRSLAENMNQGLVQTDHHGLIEYCNDHFCKIVGQSREDLLFSPFSDLIHEEDREFCLDIFERHAPFLPGSRFDLRFRVEGELRFTIASPVALSTSEGESQGFWVLVLDITERRMLEAQLLQTQKLEAIGQLAAGVAHEINTPVQYVVNNMWFIKEGLEQLEKALGAYRECAARTGESGDGASRGGDMAAVEEELQVPFYLEEIPAAVSETMQGLDRITAIVGSVKRFAHPGHDEHSEVDLNELVAQTVTVSRNEWKYVAEMSTDLDPALPRVVCSSQEIGQVLLNLVVNAAHAIMEARGDSGAIGRIAICTRKIDDMAEIRIQDSGTGIPEHVRNHLFEPFFTTKAVGKGTGQGLFIAHRVVVKEHGGSIRFETEMGHGTTFIITIPIGGRQGKTLHG